jgi:hypothetical protein
MFTIVSTSPEAFGRRLEDLDKQFGEEIALRQEEAEKVTTTR